MSIEENKACQRRLIEEFINKGNTAVASELVAEDCVAHDPPPGQRQGREGLIDTIAMMRTAFPDLEWSVEGQVAEGGSVALYGVWRGTHQGAFLGIPPTRKQVTVPYMSFDHFAVGKCTESRFLMNSMSLMQQLGVVPLPGRAS